MITNLRAGGVGPEGWEIQIGEPGSQKADTARFETASVASSRRNKLSSDLDKGRCHRDYGLPWDSSGMGPANDPIWPLLQPCGPDPR